MSRTELATLIGTLSGILTVVSFIPQAVRVWRTKRTEDLSAGTFIMLVLQAGGWTTYGVLLGEPPIVYTNIMVLLITLLILAAKVKYGGQGPVTDPQRPGAGD